MTTFEVYWHRFIDRLKTNTPLQLTFLSGLIFLAAAILGIVMEKGKIFSIATLTMFVIWLITVCVYMYTVLCVQDGKCTVLSYVFASFWLVTSIFSVVTLLMPDVAKSSSGSSSNKSKKSKSRGPSSKSR